MTAIALDHPAVSHAVRFAGLSVNGFVNAPNQGIIFFPLKPFEEREEPELHGKAVAQALNRRFASIQEGFVAVFPPPPIQGLGSTGGFKMQVQDPGLAGKPGTVSGLPRLRPILMTSFAFIMGAVPLVVSSGAGAEIRRTLGVAVFAGMLGVTFFGLVLTPVFYVVIRSLVTRRAPNAAPA